VLTRVRGVDSLTGSLIYSGESLWFLGYPDKALETCAKALERAEAANHPYSIAYAQMGSCAVRFFRKEPEAVEDAEALIARSTEHGFTFLQGVGISMRSYLRLMKRPTFKALIEYTQLVEAYRQIGGVGLTGALFGLAEASRIEMLAMGPSVSGRRQSGAFFSMRDVSEPDSNRKRNSSGRDAVALRRTRRGDREIRAESSR